MLFSEPLFLFVFLPAALLLYYGVPQAARNSVLTLLSLLFYAIGEHAFLAWLAGSVLLNYGLARALQAHRGRPLAAYLLGLGIATDLALLIVFKYADFLVENYAVLAASWGLPRPHAWQLALPLGISFFTFHKISYKIDVYRGTAAARRHLGDLCLYILLFPQLLAGPIIRYHDIAAALSRRQTSSAAFLAGVGRFITGLAKKLVLADGLALCCDEIFGDAARSLPGLAPAQLGIGAAYLGVITYTLQIYFDFSGYSDMAVGLGRMFGFVFPENFHYPYTAHSISDFWRRWHITLSRWFRDYLYIPLGGNRHGPVRTYLNLLSVFVLCGLWHGAAWNFVLWGLWHGAWLIFERAYGSQRLAAWPPLLQHLYTLLVVALGWVLFRAATLTQAKVLMATLLGLRHASAALPARSWLDPWLTSLLLVGLVACTPWPRRCLARLQASLQHAGAALAVDTGVAVYLASCALLCLMLLASDNPSPFIYYRF